MSSKFAVITGASSGMGAEFARQLSKKGYELLLIARRRDRLVELASVLETKADIFAISRGMVGIMSDIKGVDIWANFTETETGVLCELRSDKYNINPIAVKYGGGGHKKASGATLKDMDEVRIML